MESIKKSETNNSRITNEELYNMQVDTLKKFLERGAISQAQYNKSYADLTKKMNINNSHNK